MSSYFLNKKIHFVGIGGIGMSGIAEVLGNMGLEITGSDIKANTLTHYLQKIGATIYIGHKESNVDESTDVVVYSNAISKSNPEIEKALQLKIPVIPRAEMLAEILRLKRAIGIAGTHGKTTTTAMTAHIFSQAELDPTMIVGGVLSQLQNNAYLGQGEFLIYEACEAFGSIDYLHGEVICLTNIDDDHMEHYLNMENLLNTFLNYINRIPFFGIAILNGDDEHIRSLIPKIRKRFLLYGLKEDNDLTAKNIINQGFASVFDVYYKNENLGTFTVDAPGNHNILNSLGAIGIALSLGLSVEHIQKGLREFQTPGRRFQLYGKYKDAFIVDDYAHHPTEIKVTLNAAAELKASNLVKRVLVAFQPHLYSRTELHHKNFAIELSKCDFLLLAPIYEAREENISNIDLTIMTNILDEIGFKNYQAFDSLEKLEIYAKNMLQNNDLFITMGAGDINDVALNIMKEKHNESPSI